ncbi:MAG: nucleotide exchange factor GrpE [Proteobacteria bacterium]|jgi:molecular chaperone GrpE|nr:nucleotide exchange factor GrpE [Pseudomonadota bacterium]MDA0872772.1 nucleotide exchange factor GrpE [Pseudomonadota bacterium]MDA1133961.1 nucleotide exchange factor GrpE [Pseudomonadota bacterium]
MVKKETKKNTASDKKDANLEKINALELQIKELEEAVLYAKAESENARKRALDDIDKTRKFAIENFSQEILLVKDSLDAALMIENATLESYKDGVQLTVKQLMNVFTKFNIELVDPVGEKFDPNFHQAMAMIESDEEPNTVINVMQKGYKLNDRVLRPALVTVSKEKQAT